MVGRCNLPFGMTYFQWLCYVFRECMNSLIPTCPNIWKSMHLPHVLRGVHWSIEVAVNHVRPWMPPIKAKENEIGSFGFGDLRFGKDVDPSGLGPFFFCQNGSLWGGLNVLHFFGEGFFANNLAFPSVFLCVRGDIRISHAPPVPTEFHAGIVYKTRPYILWFV